VSSNTQTENYYTVEEYYGLLKSSDRRFEYWDGEIVCMAGGTKEHAIIQQNLSVDFGNRLKSPCRGFGPDMAVKAELNKAGFVFPDLSVGCNPHYERNRLGFDMITNPIVICEVVSQRSVIRDYQAKLRSYQAIASMRDYLVIESEAGEPYVTHFIRSEGGQQWDAHVYDNPTDVIEIASVDVKLTLAEIYRDVELKS